MAKDRLALVVIALALAGAGACLGRTVHTATYASMNEARASGAVSRGWVPAILPDTAYELRAAYAINGEDRWGLFNFRPGDVEAVRAMITADEVPMGGIDIDIPGRIEWWPLLLRGRLDAERIQSTGLRAYRARSGSLVVAVNWNQGRAYYWTE